MRQTIANAVGGERMLASAPFSPLNTRRLLHEGIEGGAFAIYPLAVVHGWFGISGLFSGDVQACVRHTALTLLAIVCYYAVLNGRTIWPSIFILIWLLFEIFLGQVLFGYALGGSVLNWMVLPVAIMGVRATWRRQAAGIKDG